MNKFKALLREDDKGYTPLEVLGTLFLIGILVSFLIVRFLGWRDSANDRKAQATARTVVLSAEGVYQDDGLAYSDTAADYDAEVGAVITAIQASGGDVKEGTTDQTLYISVESDSGEFMTIVMSATAQADFCTSAAVINDSTKHDRCYLQLATLTVSDQQQQQHQCERVRSPDLTRKR